MGIEKNGLKKPMIQQYKSDIGFRTLVESVNDNMYVIPKYQRKYRWSKKQLTSLVESLLTGLPIPPIYTCRNDKNQLEILDGQQRVMSLFFYYIGYFLNPKRNAAVDFSTLKIEGQSFAEAMRKEMSMDKLHIELEGTDGEKTNVDYAELPIEVRRKVDYTTITVIEIKIDPDENREAVLRKTFSNLNKGGIPLSDQEQRNGIYNCEFYDMLQKFNSENLAWRKVWGREDSKAKDIETLLRFCTLTKYAKYNSASQNFYIENYHSSYSALLDFFSEESMGFSYEEILEYKEHLEEFVSLFSIQRKQATNITLIESFYAIFIVFDRKIQITQELCDRILKNIKYKDTSRQGTAKMKQINERWKAVYEIWCGGNLTDRTEDNQ